MFVLNMLDMKAEVHEHFKIEKDLYLLKLLQKLHLMKIFGYGNKVVNLFRKT